MLVFSIQFTLLICILYALFIGPIIDNTFYYDENRYLAEGDTEKIEVFPEVLQFTKFMCALILHITV